MAGTGTDRTSAAAPSTVTSAGCPVPSSGGRTTYAPPSAVATAEATRVGRPGERSTPPRMTSRGPPSGGGGRGAGAAVVVAGAGSAAGRAPVGQAGGGRRGAGGAPARGPGPGLARG